jgi:hypothetical protein
MTAVARQDKIDRLVSIGIDFERGNARNKEDSSSYQVVATNRCFSGRKIKDNEDHWSLMFQGLLEFKTMSGHLMVPSNCEFHGMNLSNWVNYQRRDYKKALKGETEAMSQDRIERLLAIDFLFKRARGRVGHPGDEKHWSLMLEGLD